ncbi:secretory pathway protein sec39 domain-containing protein [Hirsutella rhossiliensis]|uniref:Secretory pathway protein sec39 domain-containing protein n=1 Tax=Hirsutella rhossiliensis TaxID=111463 RepID=A0A9P8N0M3_9HYPO|nr:secretory pathway protein sec39 domain-containing protein [Hirsutella rhossiliensis]KAH0964432.1 secretory pathway protein sec39 domain-containing protein [Hirsutella rhossiliensis]
MGSTLTPAKVLLLAVHLAAHADVRGLDQLAAQYPAVLHNHVLLRILLTHLPETVKPDVYVDFLQGSAAGELVSRPELELELDTSPVSALSNQLASKKANKLHLAQLQCSDAPTQDKDDSLSLFLFQRAHRMDAETGMLAYLPDLLVPFINHSPALRTWIVSAVLPFVRRNVEYYAETSPAYSLAQFQNLDGPDAVLYLLARSGSTQNAQSDLGRDLRGLIGPWLYQDTRWAEAGGESGVTADSQAPTPGSCPGWEQALEWLTSQAITSWKFMADAVEQWDGPADVHFGHGANLKLPEPRQRYLEQSYARAVLASLYMVQEATTDSLSASYRMLMVPREHIESEFLKALLVKSHYTLARRLFEDGAERPLAADVIQEVVFNSALNAFDNASNPNRARGGLKQCDEIIHAFPRTVSDALPGTKRIRALLKATHALSDYRLVLKQGEPFGPVVLRVHSDPISIIDKVLQQNPKAYTRLQEFVEMGINMVRAGLPSRDRSYQTLASSTGDRDTRFFVTERRIVAMCVEAALREDDFETAYSYVVSRLGTLGPDEAKSLCDRWSWQAALGAGQYLRTDRSQQPTHLGTASGNPEIRHLEQRMECLATALRIAPTCQLQDILKSFRRCEEQLDSAIKEEAANEAAWDARADLADIPGTFDAPVPGKADEAPMSLFDLSRATAKIAQKNLTGLSSLQGAVTGGPPASVEPTEPENCRARRRDQLREAATGTLVSSVGWLIGANVNQGRTETS